MRCVLGEDGNWDLLFHSLFFSFAVSFHRETALSTEQRAERCLATRIPADKWKPCKLCGSPVESVTSSTCPVPLSSRIFGVDIRTAAALNVSRYLSKGSLRAVHASLVERVWSALVFDSRVPRARDGEMHTRTRERDRGRRRNADATSPRASCSSTARYPHFLAMATDVAPVSHRDSLPRECDSPVDVQSFRWRGKVKFCKCGTDSRLARRPPGGSTVQWSPLRSCEARAFQLDEIANFRRAVNKN